LTIRTIAAWGLPDITVSHLPELLLWNWNGEQKAVNAT